MEVVYAESGREGIARLQESPDVDVVLMDVMMPVLGGREACRLMRQRPELRMSRS
jgi:CheY-like chemotaxis protein